MLLLGCGSQVSDHRPLANATSRLRRAASSSSSTVSSTPRYAHCWAPCGGVGVQPGCPSPGEFEEEPGHVPALLWAPGLPSAQAPVLAALALPASPWLLTGVSCVHQGASCLQAQDQGLVPHQQLGPQRQWEALQLGHGECSCACWDWLLPPSPASLPHPGPWCSSGLLTAEPSIRPSQTLSTALAPAGPRSPEQSWLSSPATGSSLSDPPERPKLTHVRADRHVPGVHCAQAEPQHREQEVLPAGAAAWLWGCIPPSLEVTSRPRTLSLTLQMNGTRPGTASTRPSPWDRSSHSAQRVDLSAV